MPGLNSSLNIALSGLQAQQSALNVVGHNIANVNTPGYTRQRANISSGQALIQGDVYYGSGANVTSVQGIRDRFLNLQITQETAKQSGAETRYTAVNSVSSLLGDTGTTGISAQLQAFFQSFSDLAARPEDTSLRTNVLGKAQNLVTSLQTQYQMLDTQRSNADQAVGSLVGQVNTLTTQIAQLNQSITSASSPDANNDAIDQRQALTDKLASLVGINVVEGSKGEYQITLDSGAGVLVSGSSSYDLVAKRPGTLTDNYLQVASDMGGTLVDVTAKIKDGQLGANLDLRDNLLVGFQAQLDQISAGVARSVNLTHEAGFAQNGLTTNQSFFLNASVANGANGLPTSIAATPALKSGSGWTDFYKGMTKLLAVNSALVADPSLIAASANGSAGDNSNALAMAQLGSANATVDTGSGTTGFTGAIGALITDLGTQTQNYSAQSTTQQHLVSALQTQRDSISGVNLDEEASNLMMLQRGYQASARFLSVISTLADQWMTQLGR